MSTAVCMVCGGSPVTKAHLYGRVLRRVFPQPARSINRTHVRENADFSVLKGNEDGKRAIDVQARVLCQKCNGEWMSSLEEQALPIVAALALDAATELDAVTLEKIASWAVAVTIVRGRLDPDIRELDPPFIKRFRAEGLNDEVAVWLIPSMPDLQIRGAIPVAQSYWNINPLTDAGAGAAYWLGGVTIVVATQDQIPWVADGLRRVRAALIRAWPEPRMATWPLRNSVTDSMLLRSLGIPDDELPERFFDLSRRREPEHTIVERSTD